VTYSLADIKEGFQMAERAVEIGKDANSPLILMLAFSIRSVLQMHFGTIDEEALGYLDNAIPTLKSFQNARILTFIHLAFGSKYALQGIYMESIKKFKEAIKFSEEAGELLNRCKGLNFLGWVYGDLGWISEAKKFNEQSYKAALEIGSGAEEPEANAIVNLAENAVAEGNYEGAQRYLEDLSKKAETDPGYSFTRFRWEVRRLCTLGEIYLHRNETVEALDNAKKAFEIAEKTWNKRGLIRANRLIGEIYLAMGDLSNAEEKLKSALVLAKEAGNPPHLWKTDFALGQLREAQDLYQEARKKYEDALNVTKRLSWTLQDKKLRDIFLNSDHVARIKDSLRRL